MVERRDRECFLAAEVVVEAALLQPGRLHEVAHRRAGVAALVEDRRAPFDDAAPGALALRGGGRGGGGRAGHRRGPRNASKKPTGRSLTYAAGCARSTGTFAGDVRALRLRLVPVAAGGALRRGASAHRGRRGELQRDA